MFYYNRYREGYKFRELDFSDIWDAGSSYSLEMKKEMYDIEIFYYTSIEGYKDMIAGGVCTTTALVLYFFIIPKLFKYLCIERIHSIVSKIIGERNYKVESYLSEIEFQFYLRVRDVKKESEKKEKREQEKIEDFIRI